MDFEEFSDSEDESGGEASYPLHNAAQAGDAELIRQLLKPPPATEAPSEIPVDDILAQYAAAAEARERPDPDERDDAACTPLHLALLHGQLEAAQALLEGGASVTKACEGSPPLHVAVCVGAQEQQRDFALAAVALLVQHGAVAYERDDQGRTALHWAGYLGLDALAETILLAAKQHAAEQLAADQQRAAEEAAMAAAAAAAAAGGEEAGPAPAAAAAAAPPQPLPCLLDFQDKQGNTPLHLAARARHCAVLKLLLAAVAADGTAPPSAAAAERVCKSKNKSGFNVLHVAALGGCGTCVAAVLAACPAAAVIPTKQGLTPAGLAAKRGHTALAASLQQQPGAAAAAAAVAADGAAQQQRTLLVAPPECLDHHTCPAPIRRGGPPPPPDNVERLTVLTKLGWGILRSCELGDAIEWDEGSQRAPLGDILRIHDWGYVRKIQAICDRLPDDPSIVGHLDGDTAISRGTFDAALAAAGGLCSGVDAVMAGAAKNVFCAVRPPGHHAGPQGVVTCERDPHGSHGFCLFNNVAVAAAYAMNVYRHQGVRRVAILDFDVHHGNGTEACVTNTIPNIQQAKFVTPFSDGSQYFPVYKPWLDGDDRENIFFASVQGYGPKMAGMDAYVYPGSGATCDTRELPTPQDAVGASQGQGASAPGAEPKQEPEGAGASGSEPGPAAAEAQGAGPTALDMDGMGAGAAAPAAAAAAVPGTPDIEEDPEHEFTYEGGEAPPPQGPRIIDVGIPGPGTKVALWRRSWRDKIIPALVKFDPDFIIISAGFDAHKKDDINFHYIGVQEKDYFWLTEQLVQVANRCCKGRIVSALEGGYRIQGGIVSAFARSVAAHVAALAEDNRQAWDPADSKWEREHERQLRLEMEARKAAEAAARAAAAAARAAALAAAAAALPPAPEAGVGPAAAAATVPAASPSAEEGEGQGRKRRRGAVDYAELNRQMEAEAAAAQRQ